MAKGVRVLLEAAPKLTFAVALDWPGWARSGRGEEAALERLAAYADRYAVVAREAGLDFVKAPVELDVTERVAGDANTDFGVPRQIAGWDEQPMDGREAERTAALLTAAWTVFDRVLGSAPVELRKGPRGGGRDRDKIWRHVVEAEAGAYAPKLGLKLAAPELGDAAALAAEREALLGALSAGATGDGKRWPPRYAARRIAWHVLDHVWEVEDRSVV